MKRILIIFCMILASKLVKAESEMKIEGTCQGLYRDSLISFTYFSTFDGCQNKSEAEIVFSTEQNVRLKGVRIISEGMDKYAFEVIENGQFKTKFWLEFPDSTGNRQGLFKYHDAAGVIKEAWFNCRIIEYEYTNCQL